MLSTWALVHKRVELFHVCIILRTIHLSLSPLIQHTYYAPMSHTEECYIILVQIIQRYTNVLAHWVNYFSPFSIADEAHFNA